MIVASLALGWRLAIYLAAGVAGGIANGVAGGGTFITFPTLLALGIPALQANVSTTVGVVPSYLAGLRVVPRVLHRAPRAAGVPGRPGARGHAGRAARCCSPGRPRPSARWCRGSSARPPLLFAAAPLVTRRLAHVDPDHPARRRALRVAILLAAVYGGYFGAGLGIMLLAVMALTLPYEIHELQGLRSTLSTLICSVAALVYAIHGHLALAAVAMLLVGALVGGWLGTWLITRSSPVVVRCLVVAVGAATTVRLAVGA